MSDTVVKDTEITEKNKVPEADGAPEKTVNDKRKKGGFHRRFVATVTTVAIGIAATIILLSLATASKFDKYIVEMTSSLNAAADEYEKNVKMDETYAESMENLADSLAGYSAFFFKNKGYSPLTRSVLKEQLGSYVYIHYYYGDSGSVDDIGNGYVIADKRQAYELNDAETYDLLNEGSYVKGKTHYSAHAIDQKSYAILSWGMDQIFTRKSILTAYSASRFQYVYRINDETNIIEDSSETELIGSKYDDEAVNVGHVNIEGVDYIISNIEGKGVSLVVKSNAIEGMTLLSYVPFADLKYDFLSAVMLPCVFLWVFLLLINFYFLKFINDNEQKTDDEIEYVHIFKKLYADGRLISHSLGLVLFAATITVASVFYFMTLLNYSDQDMSAATNLEAFSSYLDNAQENSETMHDDFSDMQLILCNTISDYYRRYPNEINQESLDTLNSFMDYINGIVVYNDQGTVEYDTGSSVGYTLIKNDGSGSSTGSGESNIWSLIDGTMDSTGFYDANSMQYCAAVRRQDKNGAIEIKVDYSDVLEVLQLMDPTETLKTADFGYSDRILIQTALPDVMYVVTNDSDEVQELPSNIPDSINVDGYSGVSRWNGVKYFINTKRTLNYSMFSAIETSQLYGILSTKMFGCLVLAFLFQELILLLVSLHTLSKEPDNAFDIKNNPFLAQTIESQTMDKRFRNTLRNMTILTVLFIVLQIIIDTICSDTPVIKYLFSSQWPKGLNMFSMTMIIIIISVGLFGGIIVESILLFFTKSMGPRGLTIGRMTSSLIKFVDLVIVIAMCVSQVGIETSTVLTGAGILGGLTLFCAQQTVNDMLSGFFLVFENQFNIGDWITVDDFRGQVVEIGIRTTRLQIQETYKVFNNSEIRKFKIAEEWDRGAIVEVDIAYKEDATKAIELIRNSEEYYRKEIPYIKRGPIVVGVTALGASGVTLGLRAIADVAKVLTTEREIRRVTKQLFDENGIEIPFTQVTLHMGDDMEESVEEKVEKLSKNS